MVRGTWWLVAGAAVIGQCVCHLISPEQKPFVVVTHDSLSHWENQLQTVGRKLANLDTLERVPVTYLDGKKAVCFYSSTESEEQPVRLLSFPTTDEEKIAAAASRIRSFEGQCATMSAGYWSYTVCPFSGIRQFHVNGKGKPDTEFHLGTFNQSEELKIPQFLSKTGRDFKTYTQFYSGGTDGRETQVHFVCRGTALDPTPKQRRPTHGNMNVAKITEDPQHSYRVTIATPDLCGLTETPKQLIGGAPVDCFRHVGTWWTAEVCPFRHAIQYHKEVDGSRTNVPLGKPRNSSLIVTEEQADEATVNFKKVILASSKKLTGKIEAWAATAATFVRSDELPYFEEVFADGSRCGKGPDAVARTTVVRYFCDPESYAEDPAQQTFRSIESFEEVTECVYKATIRLPELCLHPAFSHLVGSISADSSQASSIDCIPESDVTAALSK